MISNVKLWDMVKYHDYDKLFKAIEENAREELLKAKAVPRKQASIINTLVKHSRTGEPWTGVVFKAEGALPVVTDGYRMFFSNTDFALPEADYVRMRPNFAVNAYKSFSTNMDSAPVDVDHIQRYIKSGIPGTRSNPKQPYIMKTNNGYVAINPWYLLDALQFTGTDKVYINLAMRSVYTWNEATSDLVMSLTIGVNGSIDAEHYNTWLSSF